MHACVCLFSVCVLLARLCDGQDVLLAAAGKALLPGEGGDDRRKKGDRTTRPPPPLLLTLRAAHVAVQDSPLAPRHSGKRKSASASFAFLFTAIQKSKENLTTMDHTQTGSRVRGLPRRFKARARVVDKQGVVAPTVGSAACERFLSTYLPACLLAQVGRPSIPFGAGLGETVCFFFFFFSF